jgi:hypothetical protein
MQIAVLPARRKNDVITGFWRGTSGKNLNVVKMFDRISGSCADGTMVSYLLDCAKLYSSVARSKKWK